MPLTDDIWLVETDWLAEHLNAPDLVIVDASWHLPTANRDPHAEYLAERIPGAVFFDIDSIADESTDLPHMLPDPVKFSSRMRKLGIGDGMRIVVYDSTGIFSAPRVWWTLRTMGVQDVQVLNGGFPKWKEEGREIDDLPPAPRSARHFTARRNASLVADLNDIRRIIESGSAQIVDARASDRFRGEAPEPREGLHAGHMPGAVNVPYSKLLRPDHTLRTREELKAVFEQAGVDLSKPIVTTCGSGVTASILSLAIAIIGIKTPAVYDGSWSEWGSRDDCPIAVGA